MKNINTLKAFIVFFAGLQSTLIMSEGGIEFYNAMYQAALTHDEDRILLLKANGFNVDKEDENGSTALHYAADLNRDGGHGAIKLLIRHGARVRKINRNVQTPVDLSVLNNSILSTQELVYSGEYNSNDAQRIIESVKQNLRKKAEIDYWHTVCCSI